jgi:hypothetical protein
MTAKSSLPLKVLITSVVWLRPMARGSHFMIFQGKAKQSPDK